MRIFAVPGICLCFLAIPQQAHASSSASLAGDADCRLVNLHPHIANRAEWSGPCKDGFAHGKGVLVWSLKRLHESRVFISRFEGDVERGVPHGAGRKTIWDGSVYEGQFRDGKFDGHGTMVDEHGRYEGEWKSGMRDGAGKMAFHVGGTYEGPWKANNYAGTGRFVLAGGQQITAGTAPESEAAANGSVVAPRYFVRFGAPQQADAPHDEGTYGLDYGRPLVGEEQSTEEIWGPMPFHKSFAQMSRAERLRVHAHYPLLDQADEPPYPLDGLQRIMERVRTEQRVRMARGDLLVFVTVDANGNAVSANVHRTPKETLSNDIKAILLSEKYKPAWCNGRPCTMVFPFKMNFNVKY